MGNSPKFQTEHPEDDEWLELIIQNPVFKWKREDQRKFRNTVLGLPDDQPFVYLDHDINEINLRLPGDQDGRKDKIRAQAENFAIIAAYYKASIIERKASERYETLKSDLIDPLDKVLGYLKHEHGQFASEFASVNAGGERSLDPVPIIEKLEELKAWSDAHANFLKGKGAKGKGQGTRFKQVLIYLTASFMDYFTVDWYPTRNVLEKEEVGLFLYISEILGKPVLGPKPGLERVARQFAVNYKANILKARKGLLGPHDYGQE